MPFKSKAQRGFMFAKHPKIAEEFEEETPANAKLPEHVKKMAEGGLVAEEPMEQEQRVKKELELSPHSGVDSLVDEIPLIGLLHKLGKVDTENEHYNNPEFLAGKHGPGYHLGTDYQRGSQPFDHEADVQMLSEGGVAGMDDLMSNPSPEKIMPEMDTAGVEIPEEIREYVENAHKAIRESRPDEGWRIKPADRAESIAPYKRDDEDMEEKPGLPNYDEGGEVQPFDVNGGASDTEKMNGQGAVPLPSPAPIVQPPKAPPAIPAPIDLGTVPPPAAPMAAPPAVAPKAPVPAAPELTDQDFMERANKMLGLNPQEQAGLMKLLGGNAQKAQIGAGIAGIGDAIASGGTLGKVNPGGLARSEDLIQGKTKEGIEGMQTIRGNQEKAQELADKLEARDPKSPLSKWAQKAYGGIGKKLGLDLSNASAALIGDVSGKGVEALNTQYQNEIKMMGLDLQKKQVEATIGNQKAERDIAREGHQAEAAKTLADRGVFKTLANAIPGTAGHAATKVLENQAKGFAPDVLAYSQKHGITPEEAQAIKDKRTGGR